MGWEVGLNVGTGVGGSVGFGVGFGVGPGVGSGVGIGVAIWHWQHASLADGGNELVRCNRDNLRWSLCV